MVSVVGRSNGGLAHRVRSEVRDLALSLDLRRFTPRPTASTASRCR